MPYKAAAGVALALTVLSSAGQAEVVKLTDVQMEQITAGAWEMISGPIVGPFGTGYNLRDVNLHTYTFRPATNDYIDNTNTVWTFDGAMYYFTDNVALGLLKNGAGQKWDGGWNASGGPHPIL